MHYTIVSFVLVCLSVAAAFVARPGRRFSWDWRYFLAWIVVAGAGIFVPIVSAGFGIIALLLLALAPLKPMARVCFYIAVFTALPSNYRFDLPFPGLNYLITLDYPKLASLIVLAPLLPMAMRRPARHMRLLDSLVVLYFVMKCVMAARGLPITSVLRYGLDHFIIIMIPYFTISRILQTKEDFARAFDAVFAAILIHAFVGAASTWRQWNFYLAVEGLDPSFADARGGFLRLTSTLNPMLLGSLMGIGAASALELLRRKAIGWPRLVFYCLLFAAVSYFTESRGAILAVAAVIATYAVFTYMGGAMRALYFAGAAAGLFVLPGMLLNSNFESVDPYGTFSYRADLLRASLAQFGEHPLFGSFHFGQSETFSHLVQGTGMVDFVNAYVQVALEYGAVGLALFCGMAICAVLGLAGAARALRRPGFDGGDDLRGLIGWAIAFAMGLLVLMATVSSVSYTSALMFLAYSFAAAGVRICAQRPVPVEASAADARPRAAAPSAAERERPARALPPHLRGYPTE